MRFPINNYLAFPSRSFRRLLLGSEFPNYFSNGLPLITHLSSRISAVSISDVESTVYFISSWMSSNYLNLNPFKTEFLLIGLPHQTSKIINPSLSLSSHNPFIPLRTPETFDSSLTLNYLFPNKFPPSLAPAITTFATSVVCVTLLTLPPPLLSPFTFSFSS